MPYDLSANVTTEKDKAEIRPTEIYDLFLGDQDHPDDDTIKFANYPDDISFFDIDGNAATYTAWALQRSGVTKTADMEVDTLSIEVDNVSEAMAGYAAANDLRSKRIVIRVVFRNLLSAAADAKIVFDGIISSVDFERGKCRIEIVSQLGTLKMKTGRPYQIGCYWRYGFIECNFDWDLFTNQFFEDDTADVPDDWVKTGTATILQEEIPFPKFVHWGNHIGKLSADTGEQVYQIVTAATSANVKYYAWFWLRGDAGTETVKLFMYDDVSGTQYATEVTLTMSWKKYVISKTFGNGSTVRRVGVESTDDSQIIFLDHARLFRIYTVDANSTTAYIIDAQRTEANDYWNNGWVHFLTGDNINRSRHIVDFIAADDKAIMDYTLPNTPGVGDEYIIRRGCDKTLDRCENTFSNEDNFGGFHTIPLEMKR